MPSTTRRCLAAAMLAAPLASIAWPASAGEADVIAVHVRPSPGGLFDLDVTIRSRDTGWDRYADRFEVLAPDGTILGTRELLHPHDDEQPFTRELDRLRVPPGIRRIRVRAHMKGVGHDGATMEIALPGR